MVQTTIGKGKIQFSAPVSVLFQGATNCDICACFGLYSTGVGWLILLLMIPLLLLLPVRGWHEESWHADTALYFFKNQAQERRRKSAIITVLEESLSITTMTLLDLQHWLISATAKGTIARIVVLVVVLIQSSSWDSSPHSSSLSYQTIFQEEEEAL